MRTYTFEATITDDHRLTVPSEIPAGQAAVSVSVGVSGAHNNSGLLAFAERMTSTNRMARTEQEIDTALTLERESWD